MAKCNRENLDDVRRKILADYLDEMQRVSCMAKVDFAVTRECSCCGETGYVPTHHKYLCVFCWVSAPYFAEETYHIFGGSYTNRSTDGKGLDKVRINIPVGIEGTKMEPEVYYTKEFSARDYTQAELQAMIP